MRLFAALGPGDIVGVQRQHLSGAMVASETSVTFSGQLFAYCRARGIEALFTSRTPTIDSLHAPPVTLINVPRKWDGASGLRFHLGRALYAFRLARMARAFQADLALIDSGSAHYFALAIFHLLGVPVAVNLHNVRWPQGFEPRGIVGRAIRALDSWFYRRVAVGVLGCSPECGVQARCDGASGLRFYEWSGQFQRAGFATVAHGQPGNPFRVLFAGRIERNKGVFDLIAISRLLRQQCPVPVNIEICGDGPHLAQLRAQVEAAGESDRIVMRGRLQRDLLLKAYESAHVVIVPTRGDFCEGMPLVCAEAVLSGRPVVTSRVSNALPVLGGAVAEAEPENVESYAKILRRLAEDGDYYRRLSAACSQVAGQFLDRRRSYPAAVDRLIADLYPTWRRQDRFDDLFDDAPRAR